MPVPVGVVFVAFGQQVAPARAGELARRHGFDHIDVPSHWDVDVDLLGVPIGDRISTDAPLPGATWAPMRPIPTAEFVATLDSCPECRPETLPVGPLSTVERAREIVRQVPGLRLTVDTGHMANRGQDPLELLDVAGHVQLRQAAPGRPQLHVDDDGAVDFRAVLRRLDALGYDGLLSVEYFDLPELGFPLEDPVGFAVDLASHIRRL